MAALAGVVPRVRDLVGDRDVRRVLRVSVRRVHRVAWIASWPVVLYLVLGIAVGNSGSDAHAYWAADGYGRIADTRDAFLYSPPFLLAMQPFQALPWEAFRLLWLTGQVIVLLWVAGPILAALVLLPGAFSPVYIDLWYGNLMVFTAAIVVAGFRRPEWWAVLPFGKLLPGVAALADGWRPLLIVGVVSAGSFALSPGLWSDWFAAIGASAANPPSNQLAGALVPRVAIALTLIGLYRVRRWRWTIPLGVTLAQPILWFSSLTILLALVPLLRERYAQLRADRERPLVPIPVDSGSRSRQGVSIAITDLGHVVSGGRD